jgi:oligopeptide/dipeptide ABC transporter ATP-binding protein
MSEALLDVRDLRVYFPVFKGFVQRLLGGGDAKVHAVDGVSFSIATGEVFGLVGESGCGKSTIARTLVGLVRPTAGKIIFEGTDVSRPNRKTLFRLREEIQLIYQDPHAALSPAMTVGEAVADVLRTHGILTETGERVRPESEDALRKAVYRIFDDVGLRPPEYFYNKYPDELSGGQKQRVVTGRVLALRPKLIVADEPVAMLDMSIRARILEFLQDLKAKHNLTYLFITHDLATAKFMCDRIAIMYLGRIVEMGRARTIYADPKHPYTRALLQAIPIPDPERRSEKVLPRGEVPNAVWPPAGCRFHPRCPAALPTCGWEGRDVINLLEDRWLSTELADREAIAGPVEEWEADGLVAWRNVSKKESDPSAVLALIRSIINDSAGPIARSVRDIRIEGSAVIVEFRPPDPLLPKEVEGRTVECLLY